MKPINPYKPHKPYKPVGPLAEASRVETQRPFWFRG